MADSSKIALKYNNTAQISGNLTAVSSLGGDTLSGDTSSRSAVEKTIDLPLNGSGLNGSTIKVEPGGPRAKKTVTNLSGSSVTTKRGFGVKDTPGAGLEFIRRFSKEGSHPFDDIKWSLRTAVITNEKGETVFEQKDVEVPESWTQMATNVVVSKYFRGTMDTPERERSVKQLIGRVAETIADWGLKDGYFRDQPQRDIFRDELASILVNQYGAFNSPVWFNVGVEQQPQCSACFILSVDDTMESLLDLQKAEGMLFKYGSGAGSNLSGIRSSKELLSGGGVPSGPVSFMRGFDSWAGTIKSGGKTRRAAKMQILDAEHPDIREFVNAKRTEEQKAWALIEQGYPGGFNVPGGAYDSVFFQNSNLSVRVKDDFMEAAIKGEKYATRKRTDGSIVEMLDARELLHEISLGTWICGDPGLQFDTVINDWHTCPESGRINASNPCSEYMHLDDSACNLASINLLKFLGEDGSFDIERFKHCVDVFITAQDILVDNASYPTEKIGKNARDYRQLGLGFANIGALLMSQGLAYDSDEGRAMSGAIMAILCGEGYRMSAKIAEKKKPFAGYAPNAKAMIRVIEKHTNAAKKLPKFASLETLRSEAITAWEEALEEGRKHGYRNSQATVLAPTGTIAFLMDCDTTGIEPDIALVKYKKLVGGGMLKIVNQSVDRALEKLGYPAEQRKDILAYINEKDTIEGAPNLKAEHLPVFDCAFKPLNGTRSINYMGHIKMMAACQPFVSGAISKTVNLPENCTVEDIFDAYVESWKLGLKAVAIYRDNSKRSQPLATKKDDGKYGASSDNAVEVIRRRRLPDERNAITHKFNISGHEGYITVGLYEDGSPGEIFLVMAKEGSTISGIMDAFATSISIALQYGVPLSDLVHKFSHMRFEPAGMTNNKQIPMAKSVLDYIFKWLGTKFLPADEQRKLGVMGVVDDAPSEYEVATPQASSELVVDKSEQKIGFSVPTAKVAGRSVSVKRTVSASMSMQTTFAISDDAPPCSSCGSGMMVRQGACYRCLCCGSQGGCG
jgi:ribonucleoside-diphosphate reductase alpha chain